MEGKTQAGTLSGWTTVLWWIQSLPHGVLVNLTEWATAWQCTAAVTSALPTGPVSWSAIISATASSPIQVKYSTMHYIQWIVDHYIVVSSSFFPHPYNYVTHWLLITIIKQTYKSYRDAFLFRINKTNNVFNIKP